MNTQTKTEAGPLPVTFAYLVYALLSAAAVALLTGLLLLPAYHATPDRAYRSVQAIQQAVPLRIVRDLHHWSSALLIVLGGSTVLYALSAAVYRRPRQVLWIATIGLVLIGLFLQLTGHLLPWDVQAVRTAAIETGIAENAPLIGPLQGRLLRGGESVGPSTLGIWYGAHIALLPIALLLLGGLMVQQMRRLKVVPGAGSVALTVSVGLLWMALTLKPPLGPAAAPADYGNFDARPEWYVLPLHSLLTLFQSIRPGFAFLGTMVVPGLAVAFLLLLPWLDRKTATLSSHRIRGAGIVGALGLVVLSAMSLHNVAPVIGEQQPEAQITLAQAQPPDPPFDPAMILVGKKVYARSGCSDCHKVDGQGGTVGPALNGTALRHPEAAWQIQHLKAPSSLVRGSTMPAFDSLNASDLKALAAYLLSLK